MPTTALSPRQRLRYMVIATMKTKGVTAATLIKGTKLGKNGVYEFLRGKKGMHSESIDKILDFLSRRRGSR